MKFGSITEILRFAITKEQASVQFYQDLAAQMTDPATRSLFKTLSETEKGHVETLELEMNKMGYTTDAPADLPDSKYRWDERLEMDEEARGMGFVDALLLAIQKERAAFRLYVQLLGKTENEQFSKILMELAEEEMRHVLQLELEYDSIIHREG